MQAESVCKDCGKVLQDSFVVVESEELKKDKYTIAEISATVNRIARINEVIDDNFYKYSEEFNEEEYEEKEICFKCTNLLIDELDKQLNEIENDQDAYRNLIEHYKNEENKNENENIQEELKDLAREEERMKKLLKKSEQELIKVNGELDNAKQREQKILEDEKKFLEEYTEFQYSIHNLTEEKAILYNKTRYGQEELRKLEAINVHQDTFYIATSEVIGTINGFRLGRTPEVKVEWEEINAALGQTALLFYTLAKKIGYDFPKYRFQLLGNRTLIQNVKDQSRHRLYGSNDLGFGSWFWGIGALTSSFSSFSSTKSTEPNTLDDGMVCFLECLTDLCQKAKSNASSLDFPYKIEKDKIGGFSIRMQANTEQDWTKALKYVLITLNYLLAWISSRKT